MKTVRVVSNRVIEIIPVYATPVEKWYSKEFASSCIEAPDDVQPNWYYDSATATFSKDPALNADTVKLETSTAIKAACADAIISGFDADVLGRGSLHYTLTEIQQRDLQTQYAAIQAGATSALWHDASRVTHEVYTAAQFTALFQAGYAHIIGCKIRSDWLEQLAHDLADAGKIVEAAAVGWDTTLPESYQTQCDAQTAAMLEAPNA